MGFYNQLDIKNLMSENRDGGEDFLEIIKYFTTKKVKVLENILSSKTNQYSSHIWVIVDKVSVEVDKSKKSLYILY